MGDIPNHRTEKGKLKLRKKPSKRKILPGFDEILFLAIIAAFIGYFAYQYYNKPFEETEMDRFITELEHQEKTEKQKEPPSEKIPEQQEPQESMEEAPILPAVAVKIPEGPKKPVVAIIIDDLGRRLAPVNKFLELDIPITFSILPGLPHSKEIARIANGAGHEVMLHLSMEPEDSIENDPGSHALMLSFNDEKIREAVRRYIEDTPGISGMNNHMGSRFTKNEAKMRVVMDEIKKAGIFFIDSFTTSDSIALKTARLAGIKAAGRDIFLDNERDEDSIKKALMRTIAKAKKNGHAIAIGHPHPETIRALEELVPVFKSEGVKFVYASELAR